MGPGPGPEGPSPDDGLSPGFLTTSCGGDAPGQTSHLWLATLLQIRDIEPPCHPRPPMENGIHFISGLPRSGCDLACRDPAPEPSLPGGDDQPGGRHVHGAARSDEPAQRSGGFYWRGAASRRMKGLFTNHYEEI